MRKQRYSKLFKGIREDITSGLLKQPFSLQDVNLSCNNLLTKSPAFLGKHYLGNSGNYNVFFKRITKGKCALK